MILRAAAASSAPALLFPPAPSCAPASAGSILAGVRDSRFESRGRVPDLLVALSIACQAACSATPADAAVGTATDASGAAAANPAAAVESPCTLLSDRAAPSTILEVVDRVNELPRPVTLPCFIESLVRPLEINATDSFLSAQPAVGRRSPRAFLFADPLIMSIAFGGSGSHLLELGESRPDGRSVKAEIAFPVTEELPRAVPFERVVFVEGLTTCGVCHAAERPAPDVPFTKAFESQAYRPSPSERVSLQSLRVEQERCDSVLEPERCALLQAVFGAGAVSDRDFPATLATFY